MTSSPPHSAPADKVSSPNTPPYHGVPTQGLLVLGQQVSAPLPANRIIQTSQFHPPVEIRGHLYLLLLQSLLSQPLLIYSLPKCTSSVALCGTCLLPPWSCEYR